MTSPAANSPPSQSQDEATYVCRRALIWCSAFVMVALMASSGAAQTHQGVMPTMARLTPKRAISAILTAWNKYEVVAMTEAHGDKDMDDFILSLIRNPQFPKKVNDIVVECGNSLYQPVLDRYIAGENVPFAEVEKVWRNTTQPMCGVSGFFEQFFPLVRAINRNLPPTKRLRVLAADPPIDWREVKTRQDYLRFSDRDGSIASVMEKDVLSKHRKALMLVGVVHLMHGVDVPSPGNAVTLYERHYPKRTFVINTLGDDSNLPLSSTSKFASWSVPSLARAKGTWLGALPVADVFPVPFKLSSNCKPVYDFPQKKPMQDLVDAFLYLGPRHLRLGEPIPADIALDTAYMTEWLRRRSLILPPLTLEVFDQHEVKGAQNPLLPVIPNTNAIMQSVIRGCLASKRRRTTPR